MLSTPYYLSGKQAKQWHKNKGEKALISAATLGVTAVALGGSARSEDHAIGQLFAVGAAASTTLGAYHFTRAAAKNRELKQRARRPPERLNQAFHESREAHGNVG